ncbi:glycosyltransferase family 4 protein [Gammaproteobacteria bacterium]|nr:glycosyltransferase family 4 protein [Gammaproteobacteria bacterium]
MRNHNSSQSEPTVGLVVPGFFVPPVNGGQKVCNDLCFGLAKRVKVVCFSPHPTAVNGNVEYIRALSSGWTGLIDLRVVFRLAKSLRANRISSCIINQPFIFPLAFLACKLSGTRLFTYAHNLEFKRRTGLRRLFWPLVFCLEAVAFRLSHRVFFISPEELSDSKKYFNLSCDKCIYLPHIARSIKLGTGIKNPVDRPFTLIFFGNFSFAPNRHALEKLFQFIVPRLANQLPFKCNLIIFGQNIPNTHQPGSLGSNFSWDIFGVVPDPTNLITAADALINPVSFGAGVQTKIIESISLGTPVIAAKSGARGIDLSTTGSSLICIDDRDWQGYLNAVISLQKSDSNQLVPPKEFLETYSEDAVISKALKALVS